MPVDPNTGTTLGYCFIEFNTPQVCLLCNDVKANVCFFFFFGLRYVGIWVLQEAQNAKEKTHGYKLDKSHIFAVNMFDDFDRLMNVKEEWEAPQTKPYVPGVCLVFFFSSR